MNFPRNTTTAFIALIFMLLSVYFNFVLVHEAGISGKISGNESGVVTVCINHQPNMTQCSGLALANITYTCTINPQDPDGTHTYTENTSLFDISNLNSSHGSIVFKPNMTQLGQYDINITVDDNTGCSNSAQSTILNLLIARAHCINGIQDEDEEGIDCGGSCPGLCNVPGAGPGAGAGEGAGGGGVGSAGGGYGSRLPNQTIYFTIQPALIHLLVRQGETTKGSMTLGNPVSRLLNFTANTNFDFPWVTLAPERLILAPGTTGSLIITASPTEETEPGVYYGKILLNSMSQYGELSTNNVGVVIEVETAKRYFDLSLNIPARFRVVRAGSIVRANVAIYSLGTTTNREVDLTFQVIGDDGAIWTEISNPLVIRDSATFDKIIQLPDNIPPGDYMLAAKVSYLDSVGTSTELFTVESGAQPIEEKPALLAFAYWPFLIIIIILMLTVAFLLWRRHDVHPTEARELELLQKGASAGLITRDAVNELAAQLQRKMSSYSGEVTKKEKGSLSSALRSIQPDRRGKRESLEEQKEQLLGAISHEIKEMEKLGINISSEKKLLAKLKRGKRGGK